MPTDPADAAVGASAAIELAAAIRRLRAAADLSPAEIASRIGFSPVHVARAERVEVGVPSSDLVRALDRGLGAGGALVALRERAVVQRRARRASTLDAPGPHPETVAAPSLAAEIRRVRVAAGLSQAALARRIGYSPAYVSFAERATRGLPSINVVAAIDRALNAAGHLLALHRQAEGAQRAARRTTLPTRDNSAPLKLTIEVPSSADGVAILAGLCRELASHATQLAAAPDTGPP